MYITASWTVTKICWGFMWFIRPLDVRIFKTLSEGAETPDQHSIISCRWSLTNSVYKYHPYHCSWPNTHVLQPSGIQCTSAKSNQSCRHSEKEWWRKACTVKSTPCRALSASPVWRVLLRQHLRISRCCSRLTLPGRHSQAFLQDKTYILAFLEMICSTGGIPKKIQVI